tara:strand:+ start:92 stop:796 length:705 start_codon:yes stop_codon:yes gene_type:complete
MKSVAIIGSNGFVGKALCRASNKLGFKTIRVTRQNYDDLKHDTYDYVINTAMPSKRFWSLNNPVEDCKETILKTADIFYKWKYNKFIQISSISATKQLNMPYGIHKRAAEIIVENNENTLIVRLGALYGSGLLKSALFDLVNKNHIYVDINSEYNYIDVDTAAEWIIKNIDKTGIKNVGAKDTISLLQISKGIWDNPSYEGRVEKLYFEENDEKMPSANEVLKYVGSLKQGDML